MSYSSPSKGPGGHAYSYDDYEIPAYQDQGRSRHQAPSRPLPSQQQQHHPDPRMRFPRPQANPRPQPARPVEPPRNMYDGSDYGYDEQEQDQWPLSSQPAPALRKQPSGQFQRPHPAGARSGPPPRPQRPDYVPDNFEPPRQPARAASANNLYQQQSTQQRQPRSASAGQQQQQQYQQPYQQPQSHHGNGQWTGNGYSNAAPSNLSHGHPIVQQASYNKNTPPRPPLGPPPSARRGPSSYYSQQLSPVHPIVEEAERDSLVRKHTREGLTGPASQSRTSLASSNAIPIGIPKFYLDGRESGISITPSSVYSEADHSPPRRSEILKPLKQRTQKQEPERSRNALPSQRDREAAKDQSGEVFGHFPPVKPSAASMQRGESPSDAPIRQASLSKRSKPTLTHVNSGQRGRKSSTASKAAEDEQVRQKQPERDVMSGAPKESPAAPVMPTHTSDQNHASVSFFDSSSDSMKSPRPSATLDSPRLSIRMVNSKEHLGVTKPSAQAQPSPRSASSPLAQTEKDDKHHDALSKEMLRDPEKRGLPRQDSDTLRAPNAGFSDQRGDRRRPPRLNVDAARDEEARGSLTSLSDLIKRATRLASNLDRGKTASRLGMEGWLGPGNGNNSNSELEKYYRNRSAGSLSDILASFPPPAVPTPTGQSLANWSSRRESAPLPSECGSDSKNRHKRQRRCCGIPLWLFITLLLLLLVLIAAAVVIPMLLVVIPNMKNDSTSVSSAQADKAGTQASTLSKCATKLTCENGGQAFPTSDSTGEETCRCLCVDSFTGPTCSSKSTAGCTSMSIPDMEDNATVGSAIPRLITLAETDYNLDLDASTLLGLFNEADLSCAAENALVSFDGKAQKRAAVPQEPSSTLSVQRAEATSNGIVYDSAPSPPGYSSSSATASSSASPTASSASSASSSTAADVDVDFARAAILYIFQTSSSLDETESVQKALQDNLSKGGVVESGNWKVDLENKTVEKVE
jgi:hypothetical protein